MRKIRFRAWDKRFKKMDFGSGDLLLRINKEDFSEPMQFTGILDKNGKEIYEGDIVKHHFWDNPRKIIFRDGAFCSLQANFDEDDQLALSPQLRTFKYESDNGYWKMPNSEIIGNIHQHPELLRRKSCRKN